MGGFMPTYIKKCPECGGINLVLNKEKGEVICRDCGLVIEEKMVDFGQEWREFDPEQADKRRRTGAPSTWTKFDKGLGTDVGQKGDIYQLKSKERNKFLENLISDLISSENEEGALSSLERYNLEILKQEFEKLNVQFENPKKQKILDEINDIQRSTKLIEQELAKLDPDFEKSKVQELKKDKKSLEQKQKQLIQEFYRQFPKIGNLLKIQPLSLSRVREHLPEGTLLLQYLVTEENLYILGLSKTDQFIQMVSIPESELNEKVETFRKSLEDAKESKKWGQELYKVLIEPVVEKFGEYTQLGFIPSKKLHTLPFQALTNGEKYLVEEYSIFYLVSTSLLDLMREEPKRSYKKILAMGNADGSLKYSEQEVNKIKELYPISEVYVRNKATEKLVREAQGMDILHLATHGLVNWSNPTESFILLAPDEDYDGRLTLREIYGIEWSYEMVFLSACNTGSGKEMTGNEVDSLSNAFIAGGAKSLISTLWSVDDLATGMLSERFYSHLKLGESKARALQLAQLEVKNQYNAPYYWAAFALTGDWK